MRDLPAIYPGNVLGGAALYLGLSIGDILYYTADDTFDYPDFPGLRAVLTEGVGGGGGSGGCATTAASQGACSGGGGGAGYCRKLILVTALSASETITVGDGGAAGATGANAGGAGENTTFGSHWTAGGGGGGGAGAATAAPNAANGNGGNAGTATGGDLNIPGERGDGGFAFAARARRAKGGSSMLGRDVADMNNTTTGAAGTAGGLYGCGASSSVQCQSQASTRAGAVGGAGIVILGLLY